MVVCPRTAQVATVSTYLCLGTNYEYINVPVCRLTDLFRVERERGYQKSRYKPISNSYATSGQQKHRHRHRIAVTIGEVSSNVSFPTITRRSISTVESDPKYIDNSPHNNKRRASTHRKKIAPHCRRSKLTLDAKIIRFGNS